MESYKLATLNSQDILISTRAAGGIASRVPVLVILLAATAIPIELRSPSQVAWDLRPLYTDLLANVMGYVPVGIALGNLRPFRAVGAAAIIALMAETLQLAMVHRDPSLVDVVSDVVGASLGVLFAQRWLIRLPTLGASRSTGRVAALLAVLTGIGVWLVSGEPLNARGATSPGTLEGLWKLDEGSGRVAVDSSGHELNGRFSRQPNIVGDAARRAVLFDGSRDYIDLGHSSALRLAGSMTISAWIKSNSYPIDDAAIVSSHNISTLVSGYQLDTTVDRGSRTIGFKIADECGRLTGRYGRTALVTGMWYHVAGVYDANRRTLDVYLNGEPDNGFLLGSVTGAQRASRSDVYVGTRSDASGFGFAGLIHDVRIYSRALMAAEITSDMNGQLDEDVVESAVAPPQHVRSECSVASDPEDAHLPIAAAAVGVLVSIACVSLWPSMRALHLVASLAAGFALLPVVASTLPSINHWLIPLTSLAGGASVAASIRSKT